MNIFTLFYKGLYFLHRRTDFTVENDEETENSEEV